MNRVRTAILWSAKSVKSDTWVLYMNPRLLLLLLFNIICHTYNLLKFLFLCLSLSLSLYTFMYRLLLQFLVYESSHVFDQTYSSIKHTHLTLNSIPILSCDGCMTLKKSYSCAIIRYWKYITYILAFTIGQAL